MSEVRHRFDKGQRVRLKGDVADVYPRAFGGSEGVVRAKKYDETGHYPMIYVEWDRHHWCYNGEANMWTFEGHFDAVERTDMPDEFDEFLGQLAALIESRQQRKQPEETPERVPDPAPEREERYLRNLWEGHEFAKKCDAFMIVAVSREPDPTAPNETILVPEVYTDYRKDDAALLLDAQLSQIAAAAHTEAAATLIHHLLEKRDADSSR